MFVLLAKSSRTLPLAVLLKAETVIDHVMPPSLLVGVPMIPSVVATNGRLKLLAVTPLTFSLNVARNVTLAAFVNCPAGEERLIELSDGSASSNVYCCPVSEVVVSPFVARSVMPVLFAKSSPSVPFALLSRPDTVIDHVTPSPLLGVPMLPPFVAVPVSTKLLAETPVTASLKVARNVTLVRFVVGPAGLNRVIDERVGAM